MVASIVLSGVAIGCIYALIGIAYNVMFSASRVFSFTAGTLGMIGGVLGSLFILRMGLPIWLGFILALAGGALLGVVTEILAVRPVLKSLDQHLYVLSTLALALIVQQFTAIEWSTEPDKIVGYLNKLKEFPGIYGDIAFTADRHDGYPDSQIVMVEANSLKDGAFNLAPGYGA